MAVSFGVGIAASSILLTAFGIDRLIELVSGGILLWRLRVESQGRDGAQVEQAEHRANESSRSRLAFYVFTSSSLLFMV